MKTQQPLPVSKIQKSKIFRAAKNPKKLIYFLSAPLRPLPNFFIIGAPKCGTTSLYNYLIQHPNVIQSFKKELYFFDRYYPYGLNYYKVNFPIIFHKKNSKNILIGDATPTYLHHPLAASRIKKHIPNAKIIILLRNPIERAYSHYQMEMRLGYENLTFEEAIEQEQKRIDGELEKMEKDQFYYSYKIQIYSYIKTSIYANQVENWLKVFPEKQLLILKTEEFMENTSKVFSDVLEFLNLPKTIPNFKQYNKGDYSEINIETRKKLSKFFEPYNNKLYSLINRDFNWV